MSPILIGSISALVFALLTYGTYGLEGLMSFTWVSMVFWGLIGGGALVALAEGGVLCRFVRPQGNARAARGLCARPHPGT